MQQHDTARELAHKIIENIERVIVGKSRAVELGVIALMCEGHALIEDVPGVGKTMLARSIARSVGSTFKRIQFTPDLLPTDVTGVSIYNQQTGEFEFREGPIIAQMVLADEVNRATPKTQSAMLEAMDEQQVTVEGITHTVPSPFMVMATQNPVEYEGTFPLPEAQLDRFLLIISLGYPTIEEELEIIERQQMSHPIETLEPVASAQEVIDLQRTIRSIYVDDLVKQYIVNLTNSTRSHPDISLGASPRASLAMYRGWPGNRTDTRTRLRSSGRREISGLADAQSPDDCLACRQNERHIEPGGGRGHPGTDPRSWRTGAGSRQELEQFSRESYLYATASTW